MDAACLRALSTEDGRILLVRLLEACKLLDPASGEGEQALNNLGKWILALAGINSTPRLIAALANTHHKE